MTIDRSLLPLELPFLSACVILLLILAPARASAIDCGNQDLDNRPNICGTPSVMSSCNKVPGGSCETTACSGGDPWESTNPNCACTTYTFSASDGAGCAGMTAEYWLICLGGTSTCFHAWLEPSTQEILIRADGLTSSGTALFDLAPTGSVEPAASALTVTADATGFGEASVLVFPAGPGVGELSITFSEQDGTPVAQPVSQRLCLTSTDTEVSLSECPADVPTLGPAWLGALVLALAVLGLAILGLRGPVLSSKP